MCVRGFFFSLFIQMLGNAKHIDPRDFPPCSGVGVTLTEKLRSDQGL